MFKFSRAFLLFQLLFSTAKGVDENYTLTDVGSDVEALQEDLINALGRKRGQEMKRYYGKCPYGFSYVSTTGSCYKVVYESHDWYSAGRRCRGLESGSHLVTITSATENDALKSFLAWELSKNVGNTACVLSSWPSNGNLFWTSGQRLVENSCWSPFVWKPSYNEQISIGFTNWLRGEPNCDGDRETCLEIWALHNFAWNDMDCNLKICPLCEYTP